MPVPFTSLITENFYGSLQRLMRYQTLGYHGKGVVADEKHTLHFLSKIHDFSTDEHERVFYDRYRRQFGGFDDALHYGGIQLPSFVG